MPVGRIELPTFATSKRHSTTELNGHYLTILYVTRHVPDPRHPSCLAAPLERSNCLPRMNGPRSLILTITVLPLCVKCNFVPNGSVLCAAVKPSGWNLSPLAVRDPCMYHDANIVPEGALA